MNQELKPNESIETPETPAPNNDMSQPLYAEHPVVASQMSTSQPIEIIPSFETNHSTESSTPIMNAHNPRSGKKNISTVILMIIIIILLIAAGIGAYWWRDKTANDNADKQAASIAALDAKISKLQAELAAAGVTVTEAQTPCTITAPIATTIDNIKASITSGNTAALEGYMASSVNIVLADTGGIVAGTPTKAVSSITNFIASATAPWNFALSTSVLDKFSAGGYAKYFPSSAVVGLSANDKVISFNFDCDAKISAVLLSPRQDLLE
jgi:type II secretory pathway pseudopilin PulG